MTDFFQNYAVRLEALRHFKECVDAYQRSAVQSVRRRRLGHLGAVLTGLGRWKDKIQRAGAVCGRMSAPRLRELRRASANLFHPYAD
jgi:hypothetical protein